jgi:RNA polymerase sigma factor (sigma-70 family)
MRLDESALSATVVAARDGDERAWNMLVEHFTPTLRSVAKGFRLQPHDVDDVVQACWLAALGNLHSLREPAAIGAWLVTTARRHALRAHQHGVRELLAASPLSEYHAAPECVESTVVAAERVRGLRAAVERLPGRQREVLESLIAEPERSYVEVSQGLGIPVGSIGPTRERGLDRLRRDERLSTMVSQ